MHRLQAKVEWVRPTRQTRSQETLERLLDAAEEVFGEKGFENATVAEVVRRARSSVGAMYARFTDKDALLGCLHDRFCEEAIATADVALDVERWQDSTIADLFSEVIPFLVEVYHEKSGLIRAFIVRGSHDPDFALNGSRLGQYIARRLTELLIDRRGEINHPQPAVAIDFGLRMVFDALDQSTLFSDVQRTAIPVDRVTMARELTRAYLSYLGIEPPASGQSLNGQNSVNGQNGHH